MKKPGPLYNANPQTDSARAVRLVFIRGYLRNWTFWTFGLGFESNWPNLRKKPQTFFGLVQFSGHPLRPNVTERLHSSFDSRPRRTNNLRRRLYKSFGCFPPPFPLFPLFPPVQTPYESGRFPDPKIATHSAAATYTLSIYLSPESCNRCSPLANHQFAGTFPPIFEWMNMIRVRTVSLI